MPNYYHGSRSVFDVGDILEARPLRYYYDTDFMEDFEVEGIRKLEDIFEKVRPSTKIPRLKSIFMVLAHDWDEAAELIDAAGGYVENLYVLEPAGKIEGSDLAWYSEAQIALEDDDIELAKKYAKNYWKGIRFHDIENSSFEYRTTKVEVADVYYDYE